MFSLIKLRSNLRYFKFSVQNVTNTIKKETQDQMMYEKNKVFFERLINYNPEQLKHPPFWLKHANPIFEVGQTFVYSFHKFLQTPLPVTLFIFALGLRVCLFPLVILQMKKIQNIAVLIPTFRQANNLIKLLQESSFYKFRKLIVTSLEIARNQNLSLFKLTAFNLVQIPIYITMIFSIRKMISEPDIGDQQFLWIDKAHLVDPYYIIPFLTCFAWYYNINKYIPPNSEQTILTRGKRFFQFGIICFFPFYVNWPVSIQFYMLMNALISVFQSQLIMNPQFQMNINPKQMYYQFALQTFEYDLKTSNSLVKQINDGEENFENRQVTEEELVANIKQQNIKLNQQKHEFDEEVMKENLIKIQIKENGRLEQDPNHFIQQQQ